MENNIDEDGIEWDGRIHLDSKKMTSTGKWIKKSGVHKSLITKVLNEQKLKKKQSVNSVKNAYLAPVSKSLLARIFRIDKREIGAKIAGCTPVGEELGYPVYDLAEVSRYIVSPPDDQVVRLIEQMKSNKLPPKLRKEFWDGKNAQLKYKKESGELWHTQDVEDVLVEMFKTVRTSVMLFSDSVDREVGLTKEQRLIVDRLSDEMLAGTRELIIQNTTMSDKTSILYGDDDMNTGLFDDEVEQEDA